MSLSPVKFSGDCWPRGPTLPEGTSLQSPTELAMEVSTADQMDVTASAEATAPLPIRQPAGSNMGQFKQQAYPVISKRPEHLRMNLWPLVQLRVFLCFLYFFYMDTRGKEGSPPSLPFSAIYCSHLISMRFSPSMRNGYSHPQTSERILRWFLYLHIKRIIRIGPFFGLSTFLHGFTIKGTWNKNTKKGLDNVCKSAYLCTVQDDQVILRSCFHWMFLVLQYFQGKLNYFPMLMNCTNHCGSTGWEMQLWDFHTAEVHKPDLSLIHF